MGTDDYMTRPISVSDPLARVSRLLRRAFGLLLDNEAPGVCDKLDDIGPFYAYWRAGSSGDLCSVM